MQEMYGLLTLTGDFRYKVKAFTQINFYLESTQYNVIKGKTYRILTSMTDRLRSPDNEIVELYCHRWEIELGFREIKQTMLDSSYHLRSKRPNMVHQELWSVLLAYNLIRRIMTMAAKVTGIWPNQLSFSSSSMAVIQYFSSI
jgi:IS4 transposase